jgi:tetratricopeptide (TPR) repeat protein
MPSNPRFDLGSIRRARLFPVVLFYGSASFVVLQLCDILVSHLGLPGWVFPSALILILAGFPVVLATALVYGAHRAHGDPVAVAPARDWADDGGPGAGAAGSRSGSGAGSDAGAGFRVPRLLRGLTWRTTLLGGAMAFAALFLLAAGYAGSRAAGVGPFATLLGAGVLADQEVLVLAEFDGRGAGADMGRTVTEAVRVDLGQSGRIKLLEGERVREALTRMGRAPDEPLNAALARELAIREGVKAVVAGEVATAGTGYLLVARVMAAEDGATLVAVRETAASDAELIGAIDRLSRGLRERIGEPLRTLAARPPLSQITTSSLEALRLYARAVSITRGDPARALPLLEEAVTLDPAFVAAWFQLAVALEQTGAPTSAIRAALARGAEHLDRLAGAERYVFQGAYQARVEGDYEGQFRTYETMLERYPDHPMARINMASILTTGGEPERAATLVEPLVTGLSPSLLAVLNLARSLIYQGRPDSALVVLHRLDVAYDDHPTVLRVRLSAEGAARDYYAVERTAHRILDGGGGAALRLVGFGALGTTAAQQGRDREAERYLDLVRQTSEELERLAPGAVPGYILFWRAGYLAVRQGDRDGLRQWLAGTAPPEPADPTAAMDHPFLPLAEAWALAGDVERARESLDRARRLWPEGLVRAERSAFRVVEGLIALEEERLDEAEAALLEDRFSGCRSCLLPLVARAREAAGETARALELWDLYDRAKSLDSVFYDALWVPELYEARARLKEQLGDRAGAAQELRRALAAFSDADPVHASRVAAWLRDLRRLE